MSAIMRGVILPMMAFIAYDINKKVSVMNASKQMLCIPSHPIHGCVDTYKC